MSKVVTVRATAAIGVMVLLSATSAMAQQAVIRECAADIRAACGDVPPGAGAIRSCLNSHLADLTQPCRAILVGAAARFRTLLGASLISAAHGSCHDIYAGGAELVEVRL